MITDADRMKWIAQNIGYFEHGATKENPGNFWPHDDSDPVYYCEEKYLGMSIIEYIDARIAE
jgi:hypothetical protein